MKVSETRYDQPVEEINALLDTLETRKDKVALDAARNIAVEFTVEEVEGESVRLSNGAAGIDGCCWQRLQ